MTVTRAQQNIDSMRITAPFDGLVIVRENQDAAGGFFFFGMTLPEFREGDTVGSGRIIAEIVDATRVEMVARVAEEERGNIAVGQPVQIRFDAEPGSALAGEVAAIGGLAARRGFDSSLRRQVDVILRVSQPPVNLRTGWTAQVTVTGDVLKGVTHVARQALFEKEGKPVVHVRSPNGFVLTPVVVKHQTEGFVIVDGVADGAEVALADPAAAPSKAPAPATQPRPSAPAGGGRL